MKAICLNLRNLGNYVIRKGYDWNEGDVSLKEIYPNLKILGNYKIRKVYGWNEGDH